MTLLNHTTDHAPALAGIRNGAAYFLSRAGQLINRWVAALLARRARQADPAGLRRLDDRELRDMGIHRCRIEAGLAAAAEARSRKQQCPRR